MAKRTIIIEQNHELSKRLIVDEDTILTIGDFKIKVSEFTGMASYKKDEEPVDLLSIPAQVSTIDFKL